MEALVDQPRPWLKYVEAGDLDDDMMDFDGMDVESPSGEHIGNVDGFVVDSDSGRPYYVVVDAGGWFKSRHYLLPVGHARLNSDPSAEALVADLTRDRIERFPGFDIDEFGKLSDADLKRINDETCAVCSIDGAVAAFNRSEPYSAAWNRPDFRYPDWWTAAPTHPDRMGESAVTAGAEYRPDAFSSTRTGEKSTARTGEKRPGDENLSGEGNPSDAVGRAQPGDVIGIETGGEQTHVGETAEDEDRRREEAIKTVEKGKEKRPRALA